VSRSKRKTPICGWTTARSDKIHKRMYNRRYRSRNKAILNSTLDEERLKGLRELSDPWDAPKDGKQYLGSLRDAIANDWGEHYKECMRK